MIPADLSSAPEVWNFLLTVVQASLSLPNSLLKPPQSQGLVCGDKPSESWVLKVTSLPGGWSKVTHGDYAGLHRKGRECRWIYDKFILKVALWGQRSPLQFPDAETGLSNFSETLQLVCYSGGVRTQIGLAPENLWVIARDSDVTLQHPLTSVTMTRSAMLCYARLSPWGSHKQVHISWPS